MPATKLKTVRRERSNDEQWNKLYLRLLEYKTCHGNCLVPDRYKDDRQLSFWVQEQRKRKTKGIMKPYQLKKLCDIGFTWQVRESWDDTFQRLVLFKTLHGHVNVPRQYGKDMKLSRWVNKQRAGYCKDNGRAFPKDRLEKLRSIGFIFRLKTSNKYEDMFDRLKIYKEKYGNCMVPQDYQDDPQLGRWVNNRRVDYRKGQLSQEWIDRLKSINFVFGESRDTLWEDMYNQLRTYKEKYGNCLVVPKKLDEGGDDRKLLNWIFLQRRKKNVMSQERRTKLNNIGFVWDTKSLRNTTTKKKKEEVGCVKEEEISLSSPDSISSSSSIIRKDCNNNNNKACVTPDTVLRSSSSFGGGDDVKFEGKKYFPIHNIDDDELNGIIGLKTNNILCGDEHVLSTATTTTPLAGHHVNDINRNIFSSASKPTFFDPFDLFYQHYMFNNNNNK